MPRKILSKRYPQITHACLRMVQADDADRNGKRFKKSAKISDIVPVG
jgi:hypothetical protein